jgi:hypothetical protein
LNLKIAGLGDRFQVKEREGTTKTSMSTLVRVDKDK